VDRDSLSTVELGAHYEADVFVANYVPADALTKMYSANTLKEQLKMFKRDIDEYNRQHAKALRQKLDEAILADPARWAALRALPEVAAIQKILKVHSVRVLESLTNTMCMLIPTARRNMEKKDIVDISKSAIADADPDLMNTAGGMHLVTVIIETIQALFTTPSVLFGAPELFFGEEVVYH
jgi:hypothetical protein